MKNINTVTISGNIVKDAAYSKVCTFTVAVNENRKEGDEWVEYPNYIDCVIFGRFGEVMAEHLTKGSKVCICGKLTQSRWVDDEDNLHSRIQVVVDDLELMHKTDAEDEPKPAKKKSYSRR